MPALRRRFGLAALWANRGRDQLRLRVRGVKPQVRGRVDLVWRALSKTVGSAYVGSNPTPATTSEISPWPAHMRPTSCLGPSRKFPAGPGNWRVYAKPRRNGLILVRVQERSIDTAVPELLLTIDASGVDTEQDRDAVPSTAGDLWSGDA